MAHRYWVSTRHAAGVIGLCIGDTIRVLRNGGVECMRGWRPEAAIGEGGRNTSNALWWDLEGMLHVAEEREVEAGRRGFSPQIWKSRPTKPFVRTRIQAPENDVLISAAEAAAMLEISVGTLDAHAARGRLFVWQEKPGRSGSRRSFSANQVYRYADDEMRLGRRERFFEGAAPRDDFAPTNAEIWKEDNRLADADVHGNGHRNRRDFGEFFTTQQACHHLRVSRGRLTTLRQKGRVRGYRAAERNQHPDDAPLSDRDWMQLSCPVEKPLRRSGPTRWWFYRKDDVYDLQSQPGYAHGRRVWKERKDAALAENQIIDAPDPDDYRRRIASRPDAWVTAERWRSVMD